jgi:hypothetical protein
MLLAGVDRSILVGLMIGLRLTSILTHPDKESPVQRALRSWPAKQAAGMLLSVALSLASLLAGGCVGIPNPARIEYSTPPITGVTRHCVVRAAGGWQSSGIEVRPGDAVFIEARGRWTVLVGIWPHAGPDGYEGGWYNQPLVCPGQPIGALCGRIWNSGGFGVGSQRYIPEVTTGGVLEFVCNDAVGCWAENGGSMNVKVTIRRGQEAATGRGTRVSCDVRVVRVSDASVVASASGHAASDSLMALATALAEKLKEGMMVRGERIAVVTFRNRGGGARGRALADEVADKLSGALVNTRWFDVKERIDLQAVADQKALESTDLVKNPDVKQRLAGVRYIVIGGITVTQRE